MNRPQNINIKDWQILKEKYPNNLEEIREICYTIFNKDNASTGNLQIGDLKIITR